MHAHLYTQCSLYVPTGILKFMHSDENADEQMKDHQDLRALTVQSFAEFSFNNGSIKTAGTEITLQILTNSKNVL